MNYFPNINPSAYSTPALRIRAQALHAKHTGGTVRQRNSTALAGELDCIEAELIKRLNPKPMTPKHRLPTADQSPAGKPARAPRDLSRPLLYASGVNDVACARYQPQAPPVPPRALGSGPYSGAVVGVFGLEATRRLLRD